jgi:hypothetical protein
MEAGKSLSALGVRSKLGSFGKSSGGIPFVIPDAAETLGGNGDFVHHGVFDTFGGIERFRLFISKNSWKIVSEASAMTTHFVKRRWRVELAEERRFPAN